MKMILTICASAVAACGFHATPEGRVRLPIGDGRCDIIVDDNLGAARRDSGPRHDSDSINGAECVVVRW